MDPGPPHKRRRPAVACTECRRRKIACDLRSPCGHCRRSLSKCVYNNTGPKDHSISRDRDGNKNDNGRSSSATPQKPSSPMSNASIGRHDRQPSESVVSSNAIGDADMLANVGHGSIFDVVPHLGQPVINESELFQGPLLDASTMNIPELDFFLKCGLPDKQASPVAAGPSLGPQFDLASTVTWANMGLDMSSTTQNEFTGGTSPMKTVRYMSSSSSQSSLMPDRDSSSSSECSMATNTASFCCEGLRLLLRVFAGQEKEEHVIILPGYETVRPVMDMFAKLERFSQQRQHDRRAAILRRASITPLTASGVRDMIPSKVRCDVLVEAYSRTFESVMRILDVPVFLREYNDFWEKPAAKLTTKDEPFACKLLLVVALASCNGSSPRVSSTRYRSGRPKDYGAEKTPMGHDVGAFPSDLPRRRATTTAGSGCLQLRATVQSGRRGNWSIFVSVRFHSLYCPH
ncbi:Aspyridones cluster regulator apdR [Colletotrichum fructicola Nara gc5]|uniref:Aspyridones cluster regulator apdR n=1 Tax=Colletotrichum fructicola (strain Nara gc5) TaxID=1213859 RepID=A0A7J6JDZ8_COLFN|nr:Aspyridones cluster regulator apdR [Colletotrichum fructicola Nara gc5]